MVLPLGNISVLVCTSLLCALQFAMFWCVLFLFLFAVYMRFSEVTATYPLATDVSRQSMSKISGKIFIYFCCVQRPNPADFRKTRGHYEFLFPDII